MWKELYNQIRFKNSNNEDDVGSELLTDEDLEDDSDSYIEAFFFNLKKESI